MGSGAVFGPEFIGCVIISFIFVRLAPIFQYAKQAVKGVYFYLPPRDAILSQLNPPMTKRKAQRERHQSTNKKYHVTSIPERLALMELEVMPLEHGPCESATFFEEWTNLITMALITTTCFVATESFHCMRGGISSGDGASDRSNLTQSSYGQYMILGSLLLTLLYALQVLTLMSKHEKQLSFALGLLATIIALFAIYLPPGVLDIDLQGAFERVDDRMTLMWKSVSGQENGPRFVFSLKDVWWSGMGIEAGVITALFGLPSLRFAKSYQSLMQDQSLKWWQKVLLQLNLVLPLLVSICWVRPLTTDLILHSNRVPCASNVMDYDCILVDDKVIPDPSYIRHSHFRAFRLYLILFMVMVRFFCFRVHLQNFLSEPRDNIFLELHRPGRLDEDSLKNKAIVHFHYFPVVAVMYVLPLLLSLWMACLLKGEGYTRMGLCPLLADASQYFLPPSLSIANAPMQIPDVSTTFTNDTSAVVNSSQAMNQQIRFMIEQLKTLPIALPQAYDAIVGFFIWWCHLSWFVLTISAIFYWRWNPPQSLKSLSLRPNRSSQTKAA